jgi:2,5-dioxopentanoate dehydrogenase
LPNWVAYQVDLHGKNFVGGELSAESARTFRAVNPSNGQDLGPVFHEATEREIDRAAVAAANCRPVLRALTAECKATFLEGIAEEILNLGNALIDRASAETGLPAQRLTGERARNLNQLRMFAELVREGSWIEATIDLALPDRQPIPRPDLRRMLIPLGTVAVFGASNFPLAFSVAGGDTASALAAGNPVIFKAHPAHPGTCELVATAIQAAIERVDLPRGVFSMVHGATHKVGLALARQSLVSAIGFTGSLQGGRALFDVAASRPDPIPVYAEMGSTNPVFILPGVLRENVAKIAEGLKQSVNLGVGQFCTCPGLVFGLASDELQDFRRRLTGQFQQAAPATMLNAGIRKQYTERVETLSRITGVTVAKSNAEPDVARTEAAAVIMAADIATFREHPQLADEVFGPATLIVECTSEDELFEAAHNLVGHLTATIHGTAEDFTRYQMLIAVLEDKVGRLVFNGYPTGVEVCPSMQHGGPYPATTDARSTSVGTYAIKRFARPICYQSAPNESLPEELQDGNPKKIWRLVDGNWTKGS